MNGKRAKRSVAILAALMILTGLTPPARTHAEEAAVEPVQVIEVATELEPEQETVQSTDNPASDPDETQPKKPGRVGGVVWLDRDGDGRMEKREPKLEGVTVKLCTARDATSAVETTTTDSTGGYRFKGVTPGVYYVIVVATDSARIPVAHQRDNMLDADGFIKVRVKSKARLDGIHIRLLPAESGPEPEQMPEPEPEPSDPVTEQPDQELPEPEQPAQEQPTPAPTLPTETSTPEAAPDPTLPTVDQPLPITSSEPVPPLEPGVEGEPNQEPPQSEPQSESIPEPIPEVEQLPELLPENAAPALEPELLPLIEPVIPVSDVGDDSEHMPSEDGDGSGLRILPSRPRLDWTGVVPAEDGGMPVPLLYQFDYKTVLCKYDGIPRSVMTSGCNVTSVAMVTAYLTDEQTSPEVMFKWAVNHGLYFGDGLGHEQMSKVASQWGVTGRWIRNDGESVIAALREGKPVIAHMGPGLFTSRGHYIVLRGVTEDGKILVNDPNSAYRSTLAYPMKTILRETRTGQSFMVCSPSTQKQQENLTHAVNDPQR